MVTDNDKTSAIKRTCELLICNRRKQGCDISDAKSVHAMSFFFQEEGMKIRRMYEYCCKRKIRGAIMYLRVQQKRENNRTRESSQVSRMQRQNVCK